MKSATFATCTFGGELMDIRVGRIGQVYDDWRKMACLYKDEQERSKKIKF